MPDFLRTDDVAEAGRLAQWRHWISATFVPLECAQVSREPFRGGLCGIAARRGWSLLPVGYRVRDPGRAGGAPPARLARPAGGDDNG